MHKISSPIGEQLKEREIMNRRLATATVFLGVLLSMNTIASADVVETENVTVKTQEAPRLRLEQTDDIFPARRWDMAGDHNGFLVRDVTGEAVPFLIEARAPGDLLTLAETGRVGIGAPNPSGTIGALQVYAWGEARTVYTDPAPADPNPSWTSGIPAFENAFAIGPYDETPVLTLRPGGEAEFVGAVSEAAHAGAVTEIQKVDPAVILAKVANLPIRSWRYANPAADGRHLGPLADHFGPAFGLAGSSSHVSPADVAGVSLAAVQGLITRVSGVERRAASLEARNGTLEAELRLGAGENAALSNRVGRLARQLRGLRAAVRRLAR